LCASPIALLASQCESPDSTSPEPPKDGCLTESVVDGVLFSAMRSPGFTTQRDIQVGDRVSVSALADVTGDGMPEVIVASAGNNNLQFTL